MDTIVLTTANSKTFGESHEYSYKLTNAMRLDDHYICLSNLSMYYTWKNIKASYGNNKMRYHIGSDDGQLESGMLMWCFTPYVSIQILH